MRYKSGDILIPGPKYKYNNLPNSLTTSIMILYEVVDGIYYYVNLSNETRSEVSESDLDHYDFHIVVQDQELANTYLQVLDKIYNYFVEIEID